MLRVFPVTGMPCTAVVAVCAAAFADQIGYSGRIFTVGVKKLYISKTETASQPVVPHIEFDRENKDYHGTNPSGECNLAHSSIRDGHYIFPSGRSSTAVSTYNTVLIVQYFCTVNRDRGTLKRTSS